MNKLTGYDTTATTTTTTIIQMCPVDQSGMETMWGHLKFRLIESSWYSVYFIQFDNLNKKYLIILRYCEIWELCKESSGNDRLI